MQSYSLLAAAKINLYLEILGSRPDGFHELAMVLQSIDLCDRIHLSPNKTGQFRVECNNPEVPTDRQNLAYQAADLMAKEFPQAFHHYGGVTIAIDKQIPIGAGLAGGSTNAAAVLVGLDMMWQLGLTQGELQLLGARLGSDIPFCITGGTALATGRGEQLSPLPDLDHLWVVLAKYRHLGISTVWAYKTYRQTFEHTYLTDPEGMSNRHHDVHSGTMIRAIGDRNGATIGKALYNDFEKVVFPAHPDIQRLRDEFAKQTILGTLMSGSGSTVFALVEDQNQAEQVRDQVKAALDRPDLDFWIARFVNTSIRVIKD